MYIQCLGSGDAFGSGGRLNTCYYLRAGGPDDRTGVLLDCGATTSAALKRAGLTVDFVDCIIISHFHGDHFGGIPAFIKEIEVVRDPARPLTIIGPEGIEKKVETALQIFYPGAGVQESFPVNFLTFKVGETLQFKSLRITPRRAVHPSGTNPHCFRIESDGKVLAFSGDTEWTDELLKISDGADLFICEASFYDAGRRNHLSVEELIEKRDLIRAKRLVLTHAGEKVLEHAPGIPFKIAEDGEVLMDD